MLYRIFKESIRLPLHGIYVCWSFLVCRVGRSTKMTMIVIRSPAKVHTHSRGTIGFVLNIKEAFYAYIAFV